MGWRRLNKPPLGAIRTILIFINVVLLRSCIDTNIFSAADEVSPQHQVSLLSSYGFRKTGANNNFPGPQKSRRRKRNLLPQDLWQHLLGAGVKLDYEKRKDTSEEADNLYTEALKETKTVSLDDLQDYAERVVSGKKRKHHRNHPLPPPPPDERGNQEFQEDFGGPPQIGPQDNVPQRGPPPAFQEPPAGPAPVYDSPSPFPDENPQPPFPPPPSSNVNEEELVSSREKLARVVEMQQKEEEGKEMARVGAKLVQRGQDKAAAARANAKAALKSFAKDKMADDVPPPLNQEFNPDFAPPPNTDNQFEPVPPQPQPERNGPPPYEFQEAHPQPYLNGGQENLPNGAGIQDREPNFSSNRLTSPLELTAADDKEDALHKVKSVNQLMEELKHKRKDMVNELKKKAAEETAQQQELKAMIDKQRILKKAEEKRNMVDQMRNQLETPEDLKLPPLPPPADLSSNSLHEEKLLKREKNKKKLKRILLIKKLRELEEEKKKKKDDDVSKVGVGVGGRGIALQPTAQGRSAALDADDDEKSHMKRDEMLLHELAQNMRNLDPSSTNLGSDVKGRIGGGGHTPPIDSTGHTPTNFLQGANPFSRIMTMLDSAEYIYKLLEFFGELFIKEFKDKADLGGGGGDWQRPAEQQKVASTSNNRMGLSSRAAIAAKGAKGKGKTEDNFFQDGWFKDAHGRDVLIQDGWIQKVGKDGATTKDGANGGDAAKGRANSRLDDDTNDDGSGGESGDGEEEEETHKEPEEEEEEEKEKGGAMGRKEIDNVEEEDDEEEGKEADKDNSKESSKKSDNKGDSKEKPKTKDQNDKGKSNEDTKKDKERKDKDKGNLKSRKAKTKDDDDGDREKTEEEKDEVNRIKKNKNKSKKDKDKSDKSDEYQKSDEKKDTKEEETGTKEKDSKSE